MPLKRSLKELYYTSGVVCLFVYAVRENNSTKRHFLAFISQYTVLLLQYGSNEGREFFYPALLAVQNFDVGVFFVVPRTFLCSCKGKELFLACWLCSFYGVLGGCQGITKRFVRLFGLLTKRGCLLIKSPL